MKKRIPLFLVLILVLTACDLGSLVGPAKLTETHTIASYGVTVPAPEGWEPLAGSNYDLYLGTEDETVFLGVFCWTRDDLAAEETPADLFRTQNEQFLSDHKTLTDIRVTTTEMLSDRTIHSRISLVENAEGEFAYYFGMAELDNIIVWFVGSTNTVRIKLLDETFDEILRKIAFTHTPNSESTEAAAMTDFSIPDYGLTITAPENWVVEKQDNFDLQLCKDDMYLSIYAFRYDEFDGNAYELNQAQNNDIMSKRENVQYLHADTIVSKNGKIFYSVTYTAEKDNTKFTYFLNLVDLPDSERMAWFCITGIPSVVENHRDELLAIVESIR